MRNRRCGAPRRNNAGPAPSAARSGPHREDLARQRKGVINWRICGQPKRHDAQSLTAATVSAVLTHRLSIDGPSTPIYAYIRKPEHHCVLTGPG